MTTWTIARKDLRILSRDRYALLLLVGMPLAIMTIICFSVGQFVSSAQFRHLKLSVIDRDQTEASWDFVNALFDESVGVDLIDENAQSAASTRDSHWSAVITIDPGLEQALDELTLVDLYSLPASRLAGDLSEVGISISARALLPMQGFIISQYVRARLVEVAYGRLLDRYPLIRTYVEANRPSSEFAGRSYFEIPGMLPHQTEAQLYRLLVPSQAVLFAFFLVNIMARSFISERVSGTFQRLRTAPISNLELILGKTLPFLLVSILQGILLFLTGWLLFDLPLGPKPWLLLPVIVCTSVAATGLGLLVALMVSSDYQVNVFATFLILVMAGISGCLMPRDLTPPLMQQISLVLTPHAWSLNAYEEVLVHSPPDSLFVLVNCGVLILITAVLLFAGNLRLRSLQS